MSTADLLTAAKNIEAKAESQLAEAMKSNEHHWRRRSHSQYLTLSPRMQRYVKYILSGLSAEGWQPVVVYGRRSVEEQKKKVELGYSHTMHSLHVVGERQVKEGHGKERTYTYAQAMVAQYGPYIIRGEAADIVDARWGWLGPTANLHHPFWNDLGVIAGSIGLVWGGRWNPKDVAHVELQSYELIQDARFPVA